MDATRRFLEMVRRELGARDVRIELGLEPPSPALASAPIGQGAHVVLHFDGERTTDLAAVREKLAELIAAFQEVVDDSVVSIASVRPASQPPGSGHASGGAALALTEALELLASMARAELALVVDDASPEIWGSSDHALTALSTDDALMTARLDARLREQGLPLTDLLAIDDGARRVRMAELGLSAAEVLGLVRQLGRVADIAESVPMARWSRISHAIAGARGLGGSHLGLGLVRAHVRAFAGIYRAILVFDGPFSELHAEGALLRALPTIEKLVTSLPPRDPASGGAKVAVLRRLRRV